MQIFWMLAGSAFCFNLYAQGNDPEEQHIRPGPEFFQRIDTDKNRKVSRGEWETFFRAADRDGDSLLNPDEFRQFLKSRPSPEKTDSQGKSKADPEVVRASQRLRDAKMSQKLPGPGEVAPDFHLMLLKQSSAPDFVSPNREGRVTLSSHRSKKPVVLIFGSYT